MERAIFEDCRQLLINFSNNSTSIKFKTFAKEWQDLKLHYLFGLLTNDNEVLNAVQTIMYIAKYILWKEKCDDAQRIGALYLLYSIYYKQTIDRYVKIEVTLAQWKVFKNFITSLPNGGDYLEPKALFSKLIKENAFR